MPGFTYPSAVSSLIVGGRVFTEVDQLINLVGYQSGATNIRATFRKTNGSAGYEVPVGKSFRVMAWEYNNQDQNVADGLALCYTDNDVGINTSTAFTNPVWLGGDASAAAVSTRGVQKPALQNQSGAIEFLVPAGKFISMQGAATAEVRWVRLWGKEI